MNLKKARFGRLKNYGVVTLSDSGVNANYPWRMNFPNNGDPIGSITTDGKYWEDVNVMLKEQEVEKMLKDVE